MSLFLLYQVLPKDIDHLCIIVQQCYYFICGRYFSVNKFLYIVLHYFIDENRGLEWFPNIAKAMNVPQSKNSTATSSLLHHC